MLQIIHTSDKYSAMAFTLWLADLFHLKINHIMSTL